MKILLINSYYFPYLNGGGEYCVRTLAEELVKRGNEVTVLTIGKRDEEKIINGVHVKYMNTYIYNYMGSNSKIVQFFLKFVYLFDLIDYPKYLKNIDTSYDVVHCNLSHLLSPSIWRAVKKRNLVMIYTMHDRYLKCSRLFMLNNGAFCKKPTMICKIRRLLMKKFVKWIDQIVSPSESLAKEIQFESKVVHNGVELLDMQDCKKNNNIFRLLFLGGFENHKGIETVLEAADYLEKDIEILVAGRMEKKEEIELEERLKEKHNMKYLGLLSENAVIDELRKSHALICASICPETFPTVILHAFNVGVPVVASDCGGCIDLVQDKHVGYLFETGNGKDLAEKIVKLKNNKAEYEDFCVNIKKERELYSLEKYVDGYEKLYQSVNEV